MNQRVEALLNNQGENYIFPFFWQHGEDEKVLREYMEVIAQSNIGAVCVESRPHPDFCGPKWWADMDVILDEARKRKMKVWILDDSHFPTGYANGAMENAPQELCRQSVCCRKYDCRGMEKLALDAKELLHPAAFVPNRKEQFTMDQNAEVRVFDDDRRIGIYAVRSDEHGIYDLNREDTVRNLDACLTEDGRLCWEIPEGSWKVYVLYLSRNQGYHRNYINMADRRSCRILLDAVYEPHYQHYKKDFGTTIAGFFSDEPELGNGHLYDFDSGFGDDLDFPWSREVEERLKQKWGEDYARKLILLWENESDKNAAADVRYTYMDVLTERVEEDFSRQIGDWCRTHGVKYIGHLIEDNNQHARTGSSLGHYYRGLAGQDMAGIDDIGGQVLPGQEDVDISGQMFGNRIGEFYHYMLGKLGNSAAAIEPLKNGDSMCEIFGAYGWSEGVRLEKYLTDHFLVRGINHFVPHAFSPKEFPDPDCPPHFYAHGNNPQYRHFGALMAYMNRVCHLISGGVHKAPVAVLYHGESEWMGDAMYSHRVGHVLADAQIDYDYIPQDVFLKPSGYRLSLEEGVLRVNTQEYRVLIVPAVSFVTPETAAWMKKMEEKGIPVWFIDRRPRVKQVSDGSTDSRQDIPAEASSHICLAGSGTVMSLEDIVGAVSKNGFRDIEIIPENNRLRYYHYIQEDGSQVYLLVNEGDQVYTGTVRTGASGRGYLYNAWENCLEPLIIKENGDISLTVEPLKSRIVILDGSRMEDLPQEYFYIPVPTEGKAVSFAGIWKRSVCRSIEYPSFTGEQEVALPDTLAEEHPEFSGYVRYENSFVCDGTDHLALFIEDAHEGVEVFINEKSLGIQIAPPFRYDLSGQVIEGENRITIEVATTLEREMAKLPNPFGIKAEPHALSGITGQIGLYCW